MKIRFLLVALAWILCAQDHAPTTGAVGVSRQFEFEPNLGQTDNSVNFLHHSDRYSVFLKPTEAVLVLSEAAVLRMQLIGARSDAGAVAADKLPGKVNYLIGNDPAKWQRNIPTYGEVHYEGVYPGINLKYYGRGSELEHDFIVNPGADPQLIRIGFEGSRQITLDARGNASIETNNGAVAELAKPIVYQELAGGRHQVACDYVLTGNNELAFHLGAYDAHSTLVIDPIFSYSTLLGGVGNDGFAAIALDSSGNAYVAGGTQSINFPTRNPLQTALSGFEDAVISKLNADGSSLMYSTYLGGTGQDTGLGLAVDAGGNAYVTGWTTSVDFPTVNSIQASSHGDFDVYVAKLSEDGSSIVYSTYLGGSGKDDGLAIAVDPMGNAYVTGDTWSTDFPAVHALQPNLRGIEDAFVAKLNPQGSALVFSTYLGGDGAEEGRDITADGSGNAYITGGTASSNFPIIHATQTKSRGSYDAFVSQIGGDGSVLLFSTYLGGSDSDNGRGIAIDSSGHVYLTGSTDSFDFPIVNAFQSRHVGRFGDAFVSKIDLVTPHVSYSTYLGGVSDDAPSKIAVGPSGSAFVTGYTTSFDFPVVRPLSNTGNRSPDVSFRDAFVLKLNAQGSLDFSSLFGGSDWDYGNGIAVDASENIFVTGSTLSSDFPVVNPIQRLSGLLDGFVLKITDVGVPLPSITVITPRFGAPGTSVPVVIDGANFMSGSTTVNVSGSGISIGPVAVGSSTSLRTTFTIAAAAALGPRKVTVTTHGGTSTSSAVFTVRWQDLFSSN